MYKLTNKKNQNSASRAVANSTIINKTNRRMFQRFEDTRPQFHKIRKFINHTNRTPGPFKSKMNSMMLKKRIIQHKNVVQLVPSTDAEEQVALQGTITYLKLTKDNYGKLIIMNLQYNYGAANDIIIVLHVHWDRGVCAANLRDPGDTSGQGVLDGNYNLVNATVVRAINYINALQDGTTRPTHWTRWRDEPGIWNSRSDEHIDRTVNIP